MGVNVMRVCPQRLFVCQQPGGFYTPLNTSSTALTDYLCLASAQLYRDLLEHSCSRDNTDT